MLNLGRLRNLANYLGLDLDLIHCVLDDFDQNPDELVRRLTLWRRDPSKASRNVISIKKNWRLIQQRIYTKLLLPQLKPLECSHGGVKRRSPATNAKSHQGNTFAFIADISSFFPSISCFRVNQVFLGLACHPIVAKALTRLCTFDFHLATGLITSPILGNEILREIDQRIMHACRNHSPKLVYTRFVDDITISGKFDLEDSGIQATVKDIVERHGFRLSNKIAKPFGRFDEDISITGVRISDGHLDASKKFVAELERIIADHTSLAEDGEFIGPLYVEGEVFGKAHYACRLNPGRRRSILSELEKIDWDALMDNAGERGLFRTHDVITRRGEPRPDCREPIPFRAKRAPSTMIAEAPSIPGNAPWES